MSKCGKCFHFDACHGFNELNVTENEAACDKFIDNDLVIVLPCSIGTTVYERSKDCEGCPHYRESEYSDCVDCDKDNEVFDYNYNEVFKDTEKECLNHIKNEPVKFNVNMVNRYGKDIFLTERVAYLDIPKDIYILAGYKYGQHCYEQFVQNAFSCENSLTIVFPEWVQRVSPSFINGLFDRIMERWFVKNVIEDLEVVSSVKDLKEQIINELL